MSLELPENRQQQWQMHKDLLAHIGGVSLELLPEFAKKIRNAAKDSILKLTKDKLPEDQWPIHQEFLAYIRDVHPDLQILLEYTRNVHYIEKNFVARNTNRKPPEEQWPIHHVFLTHIKGVAPHLLQTYVEELYKTEETFIPRYTEERNSNLGSLMEEWRLDNAYLNHIARDIRQFLPGYDPHIPGEYNPEFLLAQIKEVHNRETNSIICHTYTRPEYERWQWYLTLFMHLKDVAPQHLQENFRAIADYEIQRIQRNPQNSYQRQQAEATSRAYSAQAQQALGVQIV